MVFDLLFYCVTVKTISNSLSQVSFTCCLRYCNIPFNFNHDNLDDTKIMRFVDYMQKKYITHRKHFLCISQKLANFVLSVKDGYTPSIYLDITRNNPNRKSLVKCRISDHKVDVETGRFMTRFRDKRLANVSRLAKVSCVSRFARVSSVARVSNVSRVAKVSGVSMVSRRFKGCKGFRRFKGCQRFKGCKGFRLFKDCKGFKRFKGCKSFRHFRGCNRFNGCKGFKRCKGLKRFIQPARPFQAFKGLQPFQHVSRVETVPGVSRVVIGFKLCKGFKRFKGCKP